MRLISYAIWFIIIVLVVTFAAVNSHTVAVDFYFTTVKVYLPLLLFIVLVLGAICGVLVMLPKLLRRIGHNRRLQSQLKSTEGRHND